MKFFLSVFWMFFFLCQRLEAAELSSALTNKDMRKAGRLLAFPSAHRAWTAPTEDLEAELGAELGISTTFVPRAGLTRMGDGQGIVPRIVPAPAFWSAWSLPADFEWSFSYSPGRLYDGLHLLGTALQWTFFKDREYFLSFLGNFTYLNAFGDLKAQTLGGAFQVSRPLRLWEPYAGFGFLSSRVKARSMIVAPGNSAGAYSLASTHFYGGAQFFLPAKLAVQLDFTGVQPSLALLLAHSF